MPLPVPRPEPLSTPAVAAGASGTGAAVPEPEQGQVEREILEQGHNGVLRASESAAEMPGDYAKGQAQGAQVALYRPEDNPQDRPEALRGLEARKWEPVTPWDFLSAGWHDATGVTMFYQPTAGDLKGLAQVAERLSADGLDPGEVFRKVPAAFFAAAEPKVKTPATLLRFGFIESVLPRVVGSIKAAARQRALREASDKARAEMRRGRGGGAGGPTKIDQIAERFFDRKKAN